MAITLGELQLAIGDRGGDAVLSKIEQIDARSAQVDRSQIARQEVLARATRYNAQFGTDAQKKLANAVDVTTGTIVKQTRAAQLFGRTGINAMTGVAFGVAQLAATGETSFRSLATAVSTFASFFGPTGIIVSLVSSTALVLSDFWNRQKKQIEDVDRLIKDADARRAREHALQVKQEAVERAKAAKDAAAAEFNRTRGGREFHLPTTTDATFGGVVINQAPYQRLIDATHAYNEALAQVGDTEQVIAKERQERHEEFLSSLTSELAARNTIASRTGNTANQIASILRLEQTINDVIAAGNLTLEQRASLVDAVAASEKRRADLLKVGVRGEGIDQTVPEGLGRATVAKQIRIAPSSMFELFHHDLSDEAKRLEEEAQSIGAQIAGGMITGFASGIATGGLGDAFKGATGSFLEGLGNFAVSVALEQIKVSKAVIAFQSAIKAHPVAALAIATGLLVLGRSLGGSAGSRTSSSGGGGFGGGSTATSDAIRVLIADPNIGRRLLGARATAPANPLAGLTVLGVESREGRRVLVENYDAAKAAGVRR